MKGFFAKLKDFSPKLKVSEILLFLKPQNRWEKAWPKGQCNRIISLNLGLKCLPVSAPYNPLTEGVSWNGRHRGRLLPIVVQGRYSPQQRRDPLGPRGQQICYKHHHHPLCPHSRREQVWTLLEFLRIFFALIMEIQSLTYWYFVLSSHLLDKDTKGNPTTWRALG